MNWKILQKKKEVQIAFYVIMFTVFFFVSENLISFGAFCLMFGLMMAGSYAGMAISRKPRYIHNKIYYKKISPQQRAVLKQNFVFYRQLSPRFQKSFNHRVSVFIKNYKFIGRQNFIVTDEVKTLIAGCYVELTFGMNRYLNSKFDKILLYPKHYYSNINKRYHVGEFNPQLKLIVFSWKDFLNGIMHTTDNYNLGIHEFTHAIHFQSVKALHGDKNVADYDFERYYDKIIALLQRPEYIESIKKSGFFRDYAYTSNDEFISVILEYFFESNAEFKRRFPILFGHVQKMINYREDWFRK